MVALQAPEASSGPIEHADWLELAAIRAGDSESSGRDLTSAISRAGSIDAVPVADDTDLDGPVEGEDDALEAMANAAFARLTEREALLGTAYPFNLDGSLLTAKGDAESSAYAFLTALTHFGPLNVGTLEGSTLFERVSAAALVEYLGGSETAHSYDFGSPRRSTPASFRAAINDLCERMGEGGGCSVSAPRVAQMKDAGLDLVAWVPFGDDRPNQLSVFGQCASGANWHGKITELQPIQFCTSWMKQQPALSPLAAFFVPREIDRERWHAAARHNRQLLFDRLRIARLLGGLDADLAEQCAAWTAAALT